MKLKLNLYWT